MAPEPDPPPQKESVITPDPPKPKVVVIAWDDPTMAERLERRILETFRGIVTILHAITTGEAEAVATQTGVFALIVDNALRPLSGAVAAFRVKDATPSVRVLLVSNDDLQEEARAHRVDLQRRHDDETLVVSWLATQLGY